jgi:type II secretion system protein J
MTIGWSTTSDARRRTRSRAQRAFTLIELVLAMALVSMLAASLYASMHIAYQAKRTAERAVAPVRSAAIAADLLSQDLQCALPPTGVLAGPFTGSASDGGSLPGGGEADVLDFYCVGEDCPPNQQTQPMQEGIRHVELAVRTDVDPPVLVRRIDRNLLASQQQDPEEEILCRGVRLFQVRYYDGTTWYDEWDSTANNDSLPVAVQISLELQMDPAQSGSQQQDSGSGSVYRVTRVIQMSCVTPDTTDTTTGSP